MSDAIMKGILREKGATCLALAFLLVGGTTGCGLANDPTTEEPTPARPINVILVSVDTLRPDHLGSYGYERPTSAHLDSFREDSVLYLEAIAHAPSTLPSHASLLTSLLPQHHGASFADRRPLAPNAVTLAEVLAEEGYRTASFNGGAQMARIWGLRQGFGVYASASNDYFLGIVNQGLDWIDRDPESPFMLFLHTYQVHHPYRPEPWRREIFKEGYDGLLPKDRIGPGVLKSINESGQDLSREDQEHIESLYDGEIHAMDEAFGQLVEELKARDLYDDSLIVFTSDHGEEFLEHGWTGWHSHTLYDELLRIPLMIKLPGLRDAGRSVEAPVRTIDLAPTILGILGLPSPPTFTGHDLFSSGELSEAGLPAISFIDGSGAPSIRTRRWKLWGDRLFDLSNDPLEQQDVSARYPEVLQKLRQKLADQLGDRGELSGAPVELDESLKKDLEALGYLN